MKSLRFAAMLVTVCAGFLVASSPAFAWVCTAQNARGATYTAVGVLKQNAIDRAIAKCHVGSVVNATCSIVSCTP